MDIEKIDNPSLLVSVPFRGNWGFLLKKLHEEYLSNHQFPSPFEVTGVSYSGKDTLLGQVSSRFPSPFEVTGVSYRWKTRDEAATYYVSVPSRGDWGVLQRLLRSICVTRSSFRPLSR